MTDKSALLEEETAVAVVHERLGAIRTFRRRTDLRAASLREQSKMDRLLEGTLTGAPPVKIFSKREKQILNFILAGHTNREIAQKIYRTERTVEYHRNRLMRKLDAHTSAELVKRAIAMGIV